MTDTTIAAVATAPGEAGISIIRMSGPAALPIADRVFTSGGPPPSRRPDRVLVHGTVRSNENAIDEVILLIMRAPHSYTREDVIEIQAHGGTVSAGRVLRCLLQNGATPAEPGEFTKRAFLNGRIDLLQAEAVLDLIRARSDRAAQSALEQLEGRLSAVFSAIYERLLAVAADLEASLDFSEDEAVADIVPPSLAALENVESDMRRTLTTWEEGHVLRDGALVVISGKPNVGKSTMLNVLLGRDRAIVSATPGTTRDTIEEMMVLGGVPLRLMDTAGLRDPESEVEASGVSRARKHIMAADILIHVIDCSKPLDDEHREYLKSLSAHKTILALNKSDLGVVSYPIDWQPLTAILISCLTGAGIDELKRILIEKIGSNQSIPSRATISERHRSILTLSASDVVEAMQLLRLGGDEAIAVSSARLRSAAELVGGILGRIYTDDMLDLIFSRFCVGK